MPRPAKPENAWLLELPGAAGGTVVLGRTKIHWGLQIGERLIAEKDGTYAVVDPHGDHPTAVAYHAACERSRRSRAMTRGERLAWTKAAEAMPGGAPAVASAKPTAAHPPADVADRSAPTKGDAGFTPEELLLVKKYPTQRLVAGSLRRAGENRDFPKKNVVTILCAACNRQRILPSSDLFHSDRCKPCIRQARKEVRRAKNLARQV